MSRRTVIVTGGLLEKEVALDILKSEETEFIIGVDSGLTFLYNHGILPNYIVGDFDSAPKEIVSYFKSQKKISVREFNAVKDSSDTEIAIRLCLDLGRKDILILGGTGTRLDHMWANVQALKIALDAGVKAQIVDSHNRICLLGGRTILKKEEAFGSYFSVFPLGEMVKDFHIRGAKYPLSNHTLKPFDSLCVSNEMVEDEVEISFLHGIVILMETRD